MEPVVGIFPSRTAAERAVAGARARGIPFERIQLLLPETAPEDVSALPTDDAEQPGVAKAVGGVVGGAVGASAGLGIGAAAASLLVPGVGAVTAIGLAAAALLGAAGAIGGAKAAGKLEEKTEEGLPKDEIYLYEDALAHGRSIVFVLADSTEQAQAARQALEQAGAESLDAAAESWWVGIRDAEKEHYEKAGGDFGKHENHYRCGFVAALHPECRGKRLSDIPPEVQKRYRENLSHDAFRAGFERGQARARDVRVVRPAETVGKR
jgi:hypothetical protein